MNDRESVAAVAGFKVLYPRLYALALAIQEFEGYAPGSHSYRSKNPGNLRLSPYQQNTDYQGFAVFATYFDGLFALLWDLWSKCEGRTSTGLGPESTLGELMKVYAPAGDSNDPENYASFLATRVGLPVTARLSSFLESV